MKGHAGHLDGLAIGAAALGQRDAQEARRLHGIVEKQFIEIPHPVEQQRRWMVGLDAQVLLHHGRVLGGVQGRPRHVIPLLIRLVIFH